MRNLALIINLLITLSFHSCLSYSQEKKSSYIREKKIYKAFFNTKEDSLITNNLYLTQTSIFNKQEKIILNQTFNTDGSIYSEDIYRYDGELLKSSDERFFDHSSNSFFKSQKKYYYNISNDTIAISWRNDSGFLLDSIIFSYNEKKLLCKKEKFYFRAIDTALVSKSEYFIYGNNNKLVEEKFADSTKGDFYIKSYDVEGRVKEEKIFEGDTLSLVHHYKYPKKGNTKRITFDNKNNPKVIIEIEKLKNLELKYFSSEESYFKKRLVYKKIYNDKGLLIEEQNHYHTPAIINKFKYDKSNKLIEENYNNITIVEYKYNKNGDLETVLILNQNQENSFTKYEYIYWN